MKTKQPIWKFLVNIGDANPLDRGELIYTDETGVYEPEMVCIYQTESEEQFEIFRFSLDLCYQNGENSVSDNKFHKEINAWFSDKNDLANVAQCIGSTVENLISQLCGEDIHNRGLAYSAIASYFGIENFDSYPVLMTEEEIKGQFPDAF